MKQMTNEDCIDRLKYLKSMMVTDGIKETFDKAIKALEQQPCEDCISRQAVLDVINFEDKWLFDAKSHNADTHIAFSGLESRVKALPFVTPQRQKGKWIEYCGGLQCSECGWEVDDEYYLGQRVACPNCGADMNGGGEDEDSD